MPLTDQDIETRFGIALPSRYRVALLDPSDRIHQKTQLLTPDGEAGQSIFAINADMRSLDWKQWPDYLVAFAHNGCGDYFAFDTRSVPYRVYYIDPLETARESIAGCDDEGYVFESFDDWYEHEISSPAA
jgi:hypothetical protein